jgi:hypothetical protein
MSAEIWDGMLCFLFVSSNNNVSNNKNYYVEYEHHKHDYERRMKELEEKLKSDE